ncbi:hypothetical protein CBR_g6445 [Chara braunii]|uniref:Uncharacterized protein n=1 Tax=Chara braunii TaxID=69332 RepID=A0A388KK00_CHABU|nr:hypothetical protein CBR_g6445 [Chara braunii]|eukprot:GBG70318.1 hypothetical protein CBR_g6445 [Chara braunii]
MAVFMGKPGASSVMAAALLLTVLISLSSKLVMGECNFRGSRGPATISDGDICCDGPIFHNVDGVEKTTRFVNTGACAYGPCSGGNWNYAKCGRNFYTSGSRVCRRNLHEPVYGECVIIEITQATYTDNTNWNGEDCIIIRTT